MNITKVNYLNGDLTQKVFNLSIGDNTWNRYNKSEESISNRVLVIQTALYEQFRREVTL